MAAVPQGGKGKRVKSLARQVNGFLRYGSLDELIKCGLNEKLQVLITKLRKHFFGDTVTDKEFLNQLATEIDVFWSVSQRNGAEWDGVDRRLRISDDKRYIWVIGGQNRKIHELRTELPPDRTIMKPEDFTEIMITHNTNAFFEIGVSGEIDGRNRGQVNFNIVGYRPKEKRCDRNFTIYIDAPPMVADGYQFEDPKTGTIYCVTVPTQYFIEVQWREGDRVLTLKWNEEAGSWMHGAGTDTQIEFKTIDGAWKWRGSPTTEWQLLEKITDKRDQTRWIMPHV